MLQITILAIGKIRERHFKEAVGEYAKRLRPFAKVGFAEVRAEPFSTDPVSKRKAKEKEGQRILAILENRQNAEIVLLDEQGKQFSSKEFAGFLEGVGKPIVFIIGGPLGFSEEVKEKIKKKLSLSQMTLPHELAQVVLLEQLWRAITIIKNKTYHY